MTTPLLDPVQYRPYTPEALPPAANASPTWSASRRVAFRFVFTYLVLYNLPFPLGTIPFTGKLRRWYTAIWNALVPWFGAHVLHLATPITIFPSGSGDKTYDYVQLLLFVLVAAAATLAWSLVDKKHTAYPRLAHGLRVYIRYSLAFTMLGYGAYKVIKTQFPDPGLTTLVEPFGDFSPMGVIWSWMGVSYAYNLFAGLAEMGSGFLLFFRRTTALGALATMAVLSNVVMINFAFDVPVKLYSSHLFLMGLFLLWPDVGRFLGIFVFNRPVRPADLGPVSSNRGRRVQLRVLKTAFVALGVLSPLWESYKSSKVFGAHAPRPTLYGIWEVDSFVRGHEAIPPLVGDAVRWHRMIANYPGFLSVRLLNDSTLGYRVLADSVKHTLVLSTRKDSTTKFPFTYVRSGAHNEQLQLDGLLGADSLHVRLHRIDETKFLLLSRGYHWINELPFNR
jgi:hypothetical protein